MAQKFRRFCFTLFWNTFKEVNRVKAWAEQNCQYMLLGFEVCPTTQRNHMQGWMAFKNPRSFDAIAKIFTWHLEVMRGTIEQNEKYCRKDGNTWEFGDLPKGQGTRYDLITLKEMILRGDPFDQVIDACDNLQQIKYCESLRRYLKPPSREDGVENWVLHGPSGTGKSKWVMDHFPDAYWKDKTKWWDGYTGQETVVIDDYRPDFCKFHELLNLMDRYPVRIEIKCGSDWLRAKRIIFTSNKSLEEHWASRTSEEMKQLTRRITKTVYFGGQHIKAGTGTEVQEGNTKPPGLPNDLKEQIENLYKD